MPLSPPDLEADPAAAEVELSQCISEQYSERMCQWFARLSGW